MRIKKLLAGVLSLLLVLPSLAMPFASAAEDKKDLMDNYVLHTFYGRQQVRRDVDAGTGIVGYGGTYQRNLNINVSEVDDANLAVSFRLWIESLDEGDTTDPLSILSSSDFGQIELGTSKNDPNAVPAGDAYLTWATRTLKRADGSDLVAGEWNDILLPFSKGNKRTNFDKAKITFFRFQIAHLAADTANHNVRLSNVTLVDTSRKAEVVEEPDWDTTYEVGEIPFNMDITIKGNGASTATAGTQTKFDAIDASKHNPKMLQLLMDVEVENVTNPGDVSVLAQIKGQLELTSSGSHDQQESAWGMQTLDWQSGKATYKLMLSSTSPSGGGLDFANINFMRIYMNNWPATFTDTLKIKISNVRLVDVTNSISLPTVFSDDMLFQQNKPINIWGYHTVGAEVAVKFYKGDELLDTKSAKAGEDGKWSVEFAALKGGYDTYRFEVLEKDEIVQTVENILIGELWMASGQSNMELRVGTDMNSADIIANADNPNLRFFLEPTWPNGQTGEQPLDPTRDIPGATWGRGDKGVSVSQVSSIAYTFAKNLQEELDVPVGIINNSVGGSVIEAWLPREAVANHSQLKKELLKRSLYYDEEWWSTSSGTMSSIYNQKVGPLEGMNIAGVIWYQGESNSDRSEIYPMELDLMKRTYSDKFGFENNEMPFIFTQVAPYRYDNANGKKQHLGYLAQFMEKGFLLNEDENMAMLTIYDLPLDHMKDGGSSDPIHPRIKTPVGERFFRSAMNMVYGGKGEYTAPIYDSMEIKDNAIYLTFTHVGEGLTSIGGTSLHGFTIAGEDGVYVNAEAEVVDKDTVKVWSNRVADPKNVIYAFDNFNQAANLINSEGIPASPFRTVKVNDTTIAPSKDITYFTAQDWMLADGDVWVYDSTNTENRNTGFRPSWKATNAEYSYSTTIKAEGTSSLKLAYDKAGDIAVTPILSYDSLQFKLGHYNSLTVKVLNPDAREKALGLSIVSGGKTYSAALEGSDALTKAIAGGNKFVTVTFDLTRLMLDGKAAANPAAILNAATAVNFTFKDTAAGLFFIDAVSVGMTAPVVADAELDKDAPVAGATAEELKALLESVDENLYTDESVKAEAYQAAKKAAQDMLKNENATFVEISEVYEALEEAQKTLVLKPVVDKSKLEEALKLDESLYTDASVNAEAYQAAKKAAQDILDKADATQAEVDKALVDLLEAQKSLVLKDDDHEVDKSKLEEALKLDESLYTDASVNAEAYQAAKKAAQDILDKANATQAEVDKALADLLEAQKSLVLKDEQKEPLLGDIDGNGKVDTTDARLALQYAVEKITLTEEQLLAGDVDASGKVDTTDARLILQYAVEKINKFPAEK